MKILNSGTTKTFTEGEVNALKLQAYKKGMADAAELWTAAMRDLPAEIAKMTAENAEKAAGQKLRASVFQKLNLKAENVIRPDRS